MTEYLFEYHFGGSTWGITVHADTAEEAREKIKAVGMARYCGTVELKIGIGVSWWRRLRAALGE